MPKNFERVGFLFKNILMNTNLIKKTTCILLLLIVFVSFSKARENVKHPCYVYNNQGAKELAETQIICQLSESGKYLAPHLKYHFLYDDKNRIVKKEAFRWNTYKLIWEKSFLLIFTYQSGMLTTEYKRWDRRKKAYRPCMEKAIYHVNKNQFASYSYYTRNSSTDEWILEKSLANDSILFCNENDLYIVKNH